ncbi:MAG: type IV pili methyl-accepting chemotaxis transducer N-terminal domain-containing protein [Pseudomonadota bacterium]
MNSILKLFAIILLCSSQIVAAAEFNYNRAINLAGKQRMLTQKMSKEALLVALEINQDENLQNLKQTRDLFDKTIIGLKDGDTDLGLDKTKKPKIRKQLSKVQKLWKGFDAAITKIINNKSVSSFEVDTIAQLNLPLLKEMNRGVKFYETSAASSGVNQALAKAINLSGRQRMLTQKMSKEFYLVAYGHNADQNRDKLIGTVTLFGTILNGLIDGNAKLGLPAAPTPELKEQLLKVKKIWTIFSANITAEPDVQTSKVVAEKNIPLLREMNKAVQMYEEL